MRYEPWVTLAKTPQREERYSLILTMKERFFGNDRMICRIFVLLFNKSFCESGRHAIPKRTLFLNPKLRRQCKYDC